MATLLNLFKNPHNTHLAIGVRGEALAVKYLAQIGFRLVATNFTTPIGYSNIGRAITGEVDLIAYDEQQHPFTLSFIEVKTRTSVDYATPQSAVDRQKQRHIIKAARVYRRSLGVETEPFRYDVVSILSLSNTPPQIQLLKGYFTEQGFTKSTWLHRSF